MDWGSIGGGALGFALGGPLGAGIGAGIGGGDINGDSLGGFFGVGSGDPTNPDRQGLRNAGRNATEFGNENAANYGQDTKALAAQRQYLQGLASGQNSVSAEQLRQGLQQQLAQQQSMAASGNPNDSAMNARNAAMNMAQASYGMSGQQAVAGLEERNQANQALANLNLGMRGQDVTGALGGYNAATGAYGTALGAPQKTWASVVMPMLNGLGGGLMNGMGSGGAGAAGAGAGAGADAGGAAVASDKRLKKNIADGDVASNKVLEGLKGASYQYKDPRDGKGKKLGVTAQNLEASGLGHTVMNTPRGKMVDTAQLSASNTALIAALGKRVSKLEGKSKG